MCTSLIYCSFFIYGKKIRFTEESLNYCSFLLVCLFPSAMPAERINNHAPFPSAISTSLGFLQELKVNCFYEFPNLCMELGCVYLIYANMSDLYVSVFYSCFMNNFFNNNSLRETHHAIHCKRYYVKSF